MLLKMENLGYSISIRNEQEAKRVIFNGKYITEPYTHPTRYSYEYTDEEIRLDLIDELMSWAGYCVREKVEII